MSTGPFHRVQQIIAMISAAMSMPDPRAALARIPQYRSRGHGRSSGFIKTRNRHYTNGKNPHQGPQECARRVLQMKRGILQNYARA